MMQRAMDVEEGERVFVGTLMGAVEALRLRAEQAAERSHAEAEAEGGRDDPFREGAESGYGEAAWCLKELRATFERGVGRAALAQGLVGALRWLDHERVGARAAMAAVAVDVPAEAQHARGRAEAFEEVSAELRVLLDAALRSRTVGSA